ncbi:hypothetical protein IWQ49_006224 [Labrenzia sp. EL_126]|nr:hypothetical protein [Labrenzia sp. EL_126]
MTKNSFAGMGGHQGARPTTDVWLTPPAVLDAVGGAGSFDLDPCACEHRPWDTARRHFAVSDNGLLQAWFGRVWLNPPYQTTLIRRFMARMAEHGRGLALIFARTETEHFARHIWPVCDALFFLEGRLHFHRPDGTRSEKNAGAPSVLCAYGVDDADVLAGCGLPGAFVPLRLRAFLHGFATVGTWLQEVSSFMRRRGGACHLSEIYRAFAGSEKAKRNPNYQAKIRQVLQSGPFDRVGRGLWEAAE